jgi:ribosome-binding factor A
MDAGRARKLADRIAQIVAEMLERRIKDPRLGFVTVTDARLTGDLREATVYYTVYGSTQDRVATAAALDSAKGVIRSEVGRQTGLRHTPSLTFVADTVPADAQHIEDLLKRARDADAGVALSRAGAQPAGDPDPYRTAPADDLAAEPGTSAGSGPPGGANGTVAGRRDLPQSAGGADHQAGYSAS